MYHGIPGRQRRLVRFYGQFLGPGDLAFDVGAHVGSRVRAWRRLGARVVALEPQPDFARILRLLFGRDPDVVIVAQAVGARPGTARLSISTATPTVSSMAPGWMDAVVTDRRFAAIRWDDAVDVEVTTLDRLVARFGTPAFCKIDVEGFEADVLRGLSSPLPALSFEHLPQAHEATSSVLDLVERQGRYEFAYSPIETMRFSGEGWVDRAGLELVLARIRPLGRSGDVYARLLP